MISAIIWYLFAAIAVASALAVATSKSVVHCAFGLLFALFSVAAMYAYLGADFLVATQVIVYVGGILVLVLFGVMMTHRIVAHRLKEEMVQPWAAAGAAALVLALTVIVSTRQLWKVVAEPPMLPTTAGLGRAFLTDFLFPFEFVSVLLLVAMMGAALITRERKKDEDD